MSDGSMAPSKSFGCLCASLKISVERSHLTVLPLSASHSPTEDASAGNCLSLNMKSQQQHSFFPSSHRQLPQQRPRSSEKGIDDERHGGGRKEEEKGGSDSAGIAGTGGSEAVEVAEMVGGAQKMCEVCG